MGPFALRLSCSALPRSRVLCRFEVFPKLELQQALGANIPLGKPATNHCSGLAGSGKHAQERRVGVCVRDR